MATEVIFLRVPPEVKLALQAQVDGMNANRGIGEREFTINSFVLGCVSACLFPTEPLGRTPKRKRQAKRAARRASERAA